MKKVLLIICFCLSFVAISAQISITGTHTSLHKDSVNIIIFDSITSNTSIEYQGTGTIKWYKYSDLSTPLKSRSIKLISSGTKEIYPEDATGYIVTDNDVPKDTIWVIDYSKYKPDLKSIAPDVPTADPCSSLNLVINATVLALNYKTLSGISYTLPRRFIIDYDTKVWSGTTWNTPHLKDSVYLQGQDLVVKKLITSVPICNTKFTITGDQFAELLGVTVKQAVSDPYSAAATECHITTVVTERTEINEGLAPKNSPGAEINYSVPIDVQFLSNASEPMSTYYNWSIYKDKQLIVTRTDKDQRYTFTDVGTYVVKLKVSTNSNCSYTDSITINATDAEIQVPNVFTPNGDGMNDEFRVAYRSLLEFQCWVYNRWGRQVFYWNDPQKGWNGKINGVDAAEGPYFYIIKATAFWKGTKEKTTRLLKGDINLLRGKKK